MQTSFINLTLTFERGMEQETTRPHYQVTTKGHQEDLVMLIAPAADNTFDTQPHEQEIRQSINDLCRVNSGIIVLELGSVKSFEQKSGV